MSVSTIVHKFDDAPVIFAQLCVCESSFTDGLLPTPDKSPPQFVDVVKSSVESVSKFVGLFVILSQSCKCELSFTWILLYVPEISPPKEVEVVR